MNPNPMKTRASIAGLLLTACLLGIPAAAQDSGRDTLASGERDGPYYRYGAQLVKLLPAFRVHNQATKGSGQNLEMLADGRAALGFAQADAYGLALRRSPERYGELTVLGRLTHECVFIAHRTAGPVLTLPEMGLPVDGRAAKIAVGDVGSGMTQTWGLLSSLDPALAKAEVVQRGGALALNQLSIGLLDAVGWVSDPDDVDHVMLRAVRAAPDLDLLNVDEEFVYTLENGAKVYESRTLPWRSEQDNARMAFRTVCTTAGVFAREDTNPRLVEAVSRVLSLERDTLLGRE